MELLLGSHVLQHGNRVGRLAGLELEPAERRIRRIIFSRDGELGAHAMMRSVATIAAAKRNTIELREQSAGEPLPVVSDVVLLSRATRVVGVGTDGADGARLIGVSIEPDSRALVSVTGRRHWWSGRTTFAANQLDCSIPGELRSTKSRDTRAA